MDVLYFLEQRLFFIERHYAMAVVPFLERKRQIEEGEPPFAPPNFEDDESPFLEEWLQADDSIKVVGSACISMLAASLHVYFQTLEVLLRCPVAEDMKRVFKNRGWFGGYRHYFAESFGIRFEESGCNLALLEEVVLVRNRTEHPEYISSLHARFTRHDLKRVRSPLFINGREGALLSNPDDEERRWLMEPQIEVKEERLREAVDEVRRFAKWLSDQDAP